MDGFFMECQPRVVFPLLTWLPAEPETNKNNAKPIDLGDLKGNVNSRDFQGEVERYTPRKFNTAPEKRWLEDYFPFRAQLIFSGELLNFHEVKFISWQIKVYRDSLLKM